MSSGEVHVIMGPNGSGKSTLAHALAGHPGYQVLRRLGAHRRRRTPRPLARPSARATGSSWRYNTRWRCPAFARSILLVAAGASREGLVRAHERRGPPRRTCAPRSSIDSSTSTCPAGSESAPRWCNWRSCAPNSRCSTRSTRGLDVDALGAVARRLQEATTEWDCGVLAITHFRRLLHELTPTMIHVVSEGRVVATGGPEMAEILERDGYEPFRIVQK